MTFPKQIVSSMTVNVALVLMALATLTLMGCDTTVNQSTPEEEPFEATGTLSGRVIDRVTSAPIAGASVAIDAVDTTLTTDAAGSFRLAGIPATSNVSGTSASGTYNVHISTPQDSPYRPFYTAEVTLNFGLDEVSVGSGPGNQLGASVTFPLAKLNGTVSGSVFTESFFTGDRIPTAGEEIVLYQDLALRYDGDEGPPIDDDRVRVASTETGADGSFTFDNVEEAANYELEIVFAGKEGEVFKFGTIDPATGDGSSITLEPIDVTNDLPDFDASLVSPSRGADLGTAEPAFVIAFSTPVAENDYTTPGDPLSTSGTPNISNDIFIDASATTAKARNADGEIAVDLSFNSTRDTLTITPVDPLEDGTEYELEVGGALFNNGDGFVDTYGQFINTGTFGGSTIDFSVGVNQDTPDAPNVTVTGVLPEDRDYDASVTANLEFTPGANSAPLREYEIYRRTADTDDDDGFSDDEFELVGTIDATNTNFGVITASNTASNTPFYGDDGGDYEPIAWRFRAISINGVPSDFSSVIEVGDNVGVGITSAQYVDQDSDGTDDALRMNFDEPISSFPTDASTFVSIDGADAPSVGNVIEIDSDRRGVLVEISGGTPNPGIGGDEVEITSLDDFAGNGVDTDQDVATIF